GSASELAAYLDPLADQVLIVSTSVSLGSVGAIPLWLVILVVSRDIMIVGAIMLSWLIDRPVMVKPLLVSKINTAAQLMLACLVLAALAFHWNVQPALAFMTALVAILTLLSVGLYVAGW